MSAEKSLKLRVAELEWSGDAALGKLSGQMTRDELREILSTSETLLAREGGEAGLRRFLYRASRKTLEALFRELEHKENLKSPASGRMRGVGWVDGTLLERDRPFQEVVDGDGVSRFRHIPYGFFLPTVLTNAAIAAQKRGEPTVLEGYLHIFAWIEWLISSRRLLWSPVTPKPDLLPVLVEAFGVGPEIHREDPERLMRLTARLPTWYPHRGTSDRARQLLEETVGEDLGVQIVQKDSPAEERDAVPMREEVFGCHSASWWNRRRAGGGSHVPTGGGDGQMRIKDGLLRFQPSAEPSFELAREDVLIGWTLGTPFPAVLSRVLPIWVSIRIVALRE